MGLGGFCELIEIREQIVGRPNQFVPRLSLGVVMSRIGNHREQPTMLLISRALRVHVAMLLIMVSLSAQALDPTLKLSQYVLDNWQIPQGLPQSSAQAIARTPDGYLWVGTDEGRALALPRSCLRTGVGRPETSRTWSRSETDLSRRSRIFSFSQPRAPTRSNFGAERP